MTTDQVAQFQRDGIWVDRGAFNAKELARYRELAERIQAKTRQHLYPGTRYWPKEETLSPEQRPLATWGVNEITRPELLEPELVDALAHPRVAAVLESLLGPEPRAWGIKLLWTPKVVAYDLGWHRDQMKPEFYDWIQYKPAAQDHVQFNAALQHDDCFVVVPGSHRRALSAAEWHAVREDRTAKLPGEMQVVLEPGDILYMDAHALHRGRSAIEGNRLTLHYSAQAHWVPLQPWGAPEEFAWLTSPEFLAQLAPATRPLYERLATAVRDRQALGFAYEAARAHGWPG